MSEVVGVTCRNQGLSPNDKGRQWRESLETRLQKIYVEKDQVNFKLLEVEFIIRIGNFRVSGCRVQIVFTDIYWSNVITTQYYLNMNRSEI